jgi:hypothetical protein
MATLADPCVARRILSPADQRDACGEICHARSCPVQSSAGDPGPIGLFPDGHHLVVQTMPSTGAILFDLRRQQAILLLEMMATPLPQVLAMKLNRL